MKSRWFWFSLAIFAVMVLASSFVCANSLLGSTFATAALSSAAVDRFELTPTLPVQIVSVSEAAPPVNPAASASVAMAQAALVPVEPPVPGQGGTCISGFIIDRYHQATGAGWQVTFTPAGGTPLASNADAQGRFKLDKLGGGDWTVALSVPGDWRPFTLASFPVTLSGSGAKCAEVRFKVEALACLEVTKLDESGKMGFKDMLGIPGWRMTATLAGQSPSTAVTDGKGRCRFNNLVPGLWTVEEEAKVGWIPALQGSKQTINLDSPRTPSVCGSLTFVNRQVYDGCIQVQKVDAVGNPLQGWKITIKRDDGTQPGASKTTNAWGYATFDQLALGQWTVEEEVKDWWRPLGPSKQIVVLLEPGRCEFVTFRNEPSGCVDGYKINHLEQGLAGWTIRARNVNTNEEHSAVTDSSGYFKIKGLAPGVWKVSEDLQTGWTPITPAEFDVEVTKLFECQHVRFKNKTDFACVDVYKKDAADGAGLPGWVVTVQPAYGGSPVSGTTDGTGHARFNGLTPGAYIVSENMQSGWTAATPQSQKVTLTASGACFVVNLSNYQTGSSSTVSLGGCRATHVVGRGNTLYSIARQYGSTAAAIKQANGLSSNVIWPGQKLCIP